MRIIVIEGSDGTGKSTLVDNLGNWLRPHVRLSCGPPKTESAFVEYSALIDAAEEIAATSDSHVIIDRLHLGEMVYGTLLRGTPKLSLQELRALSTRLDNLGAVRVLLNASDECVIGRLVARDGGVPDPKSGAKCEQTPQISLLFRAFGRYDKWRVVNADQHPLAIAREVAELTVSPEV